MPWNLSGAKNNWPLVPTRPDSVYLSDVYGLYYAEAACGEESDIALVEVDDSQLDPDLIMPDEDFVAQIFSDARAIGDELPAEIEACSDIHEITNLIEPRRFSSMANASRIYGGNIAYVGSVPPSAIKRIVILPFQDNQVLYHLIRDPALSIINLQLVGERYASICNFVIQGKSHPYGAMTAEEYLAMPSIAVKTRNDLFERVDGLNRHAMREHRGLKPIDVFADDAAVDLNHKRVRKLNEKASSLFKA